VAERDVILCVEHVSKVYRMGEVDVHALRDATIDIFDGELLVVEGASGSGKTTLLNMVAGMDRPTSGKVAFRGTEISAFNDRALTRYRRTQVGFVFQFFNLIPTLTAVENVQVATEVATDPLDAAEALGLVGLGDRADHFPSQLSGGEQQRVAIARALASNPGMLLCDEPTGALDSETAVGVLGLLLELKSRLRKTVILITHNGEIARIGDRIAVIRDGVIAQVRENAPPLAASELDL